MPSLDALPIDLMYEIYSHLVHPLSSHEGKSAPVSREEQLRIEGLRSDRVQLMQHPYCQLAATCHELRSSVEAFCLHLIKGQKFPTGRRYPATKNGRTKIPQTTKDDWSTAVAKGKATGALPKPKEACRNLYLRSVFQRCIFCGAGSKRRAAFNRFMWCDQKCDIEHYSRLIVSSFLLLSIVVLTLTRCTEQKRSRR